MLSRISRSTLIPLFRSKTSFVATATTANIIIFRALHGVSCGYPLLCESIIGGLTIEFSEKSSSLRSAPKKNTNRQDGPPTHLDRFFAKYPAFKRDPSKSAVTEFNRMREFFGWTKDNEEGRKASREFRDAMSKQFNDIYGTDVKSLDSWRKLCQVLEIFPIPTTVKRCREVSDGMATFMV